MEPEASQAAIAAIAALQDRIRRLEEEGAQLQREYTELKTIVDARDKTYSARESAINDASEKAQLMLSTAAQTMNQIRESRSDNHALKHQIEETEALLSDNIKKKREMNRVLKDTNVQFLLLKQKLLEYELLMQDLLAPPPNAIPTNDEALVLATSASDPDLFPEPLAELIRTMKQLPKTFSKQPIEMKRAIVLALSSAKSASTELANKIKALEKQRFSSGTPKKINTEIRRIQAKIIVITNEMKKFQF